MSFTPRERALLLVAPRIGPAVVERLEEAGLNSFAKLRALGVDAAVQLICSQLESRGWANRRSALQQVLATTGIDQDADPMLAHRTLACRGRHS